MPRPGFAYTMFKLGDDSVAGMLGIAPEMGNVPSHWATYFTVPDADEAARKAVALSAILGPPLSDLPGVGRTCGLTSPQGVPFHVMCHTA